MDPQTSRRIALAVNVLDIDFDERQKIAEEAERAASFDDLSENTQTLVKRAEAKVADERRGQGRDTSGRKI